MDTKSVSSKCRLYLATGSKKVGKNFQTISKYEKDSTLIPFELLKDLSELYHVKLDDIFLGDSTKKIELEPED